MNFFRKLKCAFIVICLFVCFCAPSYAINADIGNDASVSVKAKYTSGVASEVYSVDIEWGSMEFEYVDAKTKWNPETHAYDVEKPAEWKCTEGADNVKVTNHSNQPVKVALSYTSKTGFSDITGTFDVAEKILASAENIGSGNAPSFTSKLTLSGALSSNETSLTDIGTAKVTLSAVDAGDEGEGENEEVISKEPVGYIFLDALINEGESSEYQTSIYQQSSNTYVADICADQVIKSDFAPDTKIYINGTQYYIYEKDEGYQFIPDATVNINTKYFDYLDDKDRPCRKETVIEAGKTYKLTITLDEASGTGTATLVKVEA